MVRQSFMSESEDTWSLEEWILDTLLVILDEAWECQQSEDVFLAEEV